MIIQNNNYVRGRELVNYIFVSALRLLKKKTQKRKRLWATEWFVRKCDLGVHERLMSRF